MPLVADWTPLGAPVPQPAWAPSAAFPNIIPSWFRLVQTLSGLDAVGGNILVHSTDGASGADSAYANVIWTAPAPGTISIGGDIWMARNIGRSNQWTISHNGVLLTDGEVTSTDPYSRTNPMPFSAGTGGASVLTGITVAENDVIELAVHRLGIFGDFCGVHLSVDQTLGPVSVPGGDDSLNSGLRAFPNPVRAGTMIGFSLPVPEYVLLDVITVQGRRVNRLLDEVRAAGPHAVTWRGNDDMGRRVPAGVYLVALRAGDISRTTRVLILH